jgi:copper chaperone CopZ
MQQVLKISGMHCAACVNRVTRALRTVTPDVTVSLDPPQAVLTVAEPLPLDVLAAAVASAGGYEVKAET